VGSEPRRSRVWTLEPFEADDGTVPFSRFIEDLSDFTFAALDAAIGRVLAVRGIDLVRTEWLKALGDGLHEFRVRHEADDVAHMFGGEPPNVVAPAEKRQRQQRRRRPDAQKRRRKVGGSWGTPHTRPEENR
jgi:hypothetical protein